MLARIAAAASGAVLLALAATPTPAAAQNYSIQSCHRNALAHSHPGLGYAWHYHNNRCVPVRVVQPKPPKPADCHANPQRHWLPGYGTVWHRHNQNSCNPQILRSTNRRQSSSCIQVGPLWICP